MPPRTATAGARKRPGGRGLSPLDRVKYERLLHLRALRRQSDARKRKITASRWATPGDMALELDPDNTIQTAALDIIDAALVRIYRGEIKRLIISLPPQEGKSQRVSRRLPLWWLNRNADARLVIASYEKGVARRWGRTIKNDIAQHGDTLGLRVRDDTSAAHEWQLDGAEGGVYCVGIGGALTGRPADVMIVDDPHKGRKEADSAVQRETVWDWWTETARTRFGANTPVIVIMTRWHEDDLAGRLIENDKGAWTVVNIPAEANHKPAEGQTDPLGREPGQFLESTRGRHITRPIGKCELHPLGVEKADGTFRECCDWDDIRHDVGARGWEALYQGNPTPSTGAIFKKAHLKAAQYDAPMWTERADGSFWAIGFDEVIQSWDMAFKDTEGSDYVCGQVWGRRGHHIYLLDQVYDRMDFVATCHAVRELSARWPQASLKLVEDKANGPAVIAQLRRKVPGMVGVEPNGSKVARAAAVSPFVEAGEVHLPAPELCPWAGALVAELTQFPQSPNDDRTDALTQAGDRLLLNPLLADDSVIEDDEDGPAEGRISLY
jgi:predicted phage terminase large subunit-like protein